MSEFPQKKKVVQKTQQNSEKKQTTTKPMKRPIRTTHTLEKEELRMFSLKEHKQYSPAVMFAQLGFKV